MLNKFIFLFLALAIGGCGNDDNIIPVDAETSLMVTSRIIDREVDSFDVTDKFGALTVVAGEYTYNTELKPWSSWWFPSIDRYLFSTQEGLAPLEKYDEYVMLRHDQVSESAHYEESKLYNPAQAAWAGLCHAWAVASLLHREPNRLIYKEGMAFSIADQKALLLKSYENVSNLEIYGKRYDGLYDNDFQDIYPDQFHRFMQYSLRDENKPFIMDYDPSYPVWTVPVYIAKTNIVEVDSETMAVKTWVTYASPFVDHHFVGTRQIVKSYTYNLYGEWINGAFTVRDSEWTDSSVHDHPDYVIAFPKTAVRGTYNTELNVRLIDEILKN
jgi:hypothetical protein